ncbi:unnamed protein product [Effrenium voratum]|nr:unnamed protein product [Effrenium voratum]
MAREGLARVLCGRHDPLPRRRQVLSEAQLLEGLEQAEHLASSPAPSGSPVMRAASDPLAFTPHVSSSGSGQRASPIPEFQLQELSSEWP